MSREKTIVERRYSGIPLENKVQQAIDQLSNRKEQDADVVTINFKSV